LYFISVVADMQLADDDDHALKLRSTVEHGEMTTQIPFDFGLPGSNRFMEHPNQRDGGEDHARIFKGMLRKELKPILDVKVLKGTVYSFKNRRIITRWIRDVCHAFHHKTTTFNIAVQFTDSFLYHNRSQFPVNQCQLVALASIWIAAKFEELDKHVPSLQALNDVCDRAYSKDQIIDMEETLLDFCKYKVPHTTATNFMHLYLHTVPAIAATAAGSPLSSAPAAGSAAVPRLRDLVVPLNETIGRPGQDESARSNLPKTSPPARAGQIDVVVVDRNTHAMSYRSITGVADSTRLASLLPQVAAAMRTPASNEISLYFVLDTPIRLARPVAGMTYAEAIEIVSSAGLNGRVPLLYGRHAAVPNCVFAERSGWLLLRTPNDEVLRVTEASLREALINVEFLKVDPHVVGLAALAFALAIASGSPRAAAATVLAIQQHVGPTPWDHLKSAVQLIGEKYVEMTQSQSAEADGKGPAPLPLPPNMQARIDEMLAVAFQKMAPTVVVGGSVPRQRPGSADVL
jgi:hypothetical protein